MNSSQNAGSEVNPNTAPNTAMEYWYFAYGSNLLVEQMRNRLGAEFIAEQNSEAVTNEPTTIDLAPRIVKLPKYRVDFSMLSTNGQYYANIVPADEDALGVIYRCSKYGLELLDTFETGYQRVTKQVYDTEGQAFDAMVYVAKPESLSKSGKPSIEYLNRILQGGKAHRLPQEYLNQLIATASCINA